MIPHYAQAVEMADMALTTATDPEIRTLATAIKGAQDPEIATMTGWLKDWNAPVPPTGAGHMTGMAITGMMSDAEMTDLGKATGKAFDKMWVSMMTPPPGRHRHGEHRAEPRSEKRRQDSCSADHHRPDRRGRQDEGDRHPDRLSVDSGWLGASPPTHSWLLVRSSLDTRRNVAPLRRVDVAGRRWPVRRLNVSMDFGARRVQGCA